MNRMEFLAMELMLDDACDMRVRKAGIYRFANKYHFNTHKHLEYEINHVSSGCCTMVIDNQVIHIKQGECIIIPAFKLHSFTVDNASGCKLTQIELAVKMEDEISMTFPFFYQERNYYVVKQCEEFIPLIESIARLHRRDNKDEYTSTMMKMHIIELMLTIRHTMQESESHDDIDIENQLDNIVNYINTHYMEEINLTELAHKYGISSRYVRKCFEKQLGITGIDYITNLRLQNAKHLLWETDKNILTVAIESGYNSAQYFSRLFKEKEGITPKEYRMLWKDNMSSEKYNK